MEEAIFVLVLLGIVSLIMMVVVAAVAGVAALCGASFPPVFLNGLWSLLLPPLFILYGWLYGRDRVVVNRVEIPSAGLPDAFDGYRIVHISDLHLRSFRGRDEVLRRIVDMVNAEHPDIIVFTGDLVTETPEEIPHFTGELSRMRAADGVLSVMGNHDYCPYNDWNSMEERMAAVAQVRESEKGLGWNLLDDDSFVVRRPSAAGEDSIAVIGVENISAMKQFETHGDLGKAMKGTGNCFKILLSHDPTHWRHEVTGKTDIALTMSGHTHNAQFSFMGLEPSRLVFRENSGLYRDGEQYLYVNDGLGETMFPARIGVPAEITVLTLRKGR